MIEKTSEKSLYERLGGHAAIAAVVDELFARKCADKQLNRFFLGMSDGIAIKTKENVVNFLCNATGGPFDYKGRDLVAVHTGMNMTEDDWKIFVKIAAETLNKFNVPQKEADDVFAAISGLKQNIVGL